MSAYFSTDHVYKTYTQILTPTYIDIQTFIYIYCKYPPIYMYVKPGLTQVAGDRKVDSGQRQL